MAPVAQSLGQVGMYSAIDLFSNYAGMKTDLAPWLADAAINRDRNLRLQYLAGLGLNLYQSESIYADMLTHASGWPNGLFVASDTTNAALRAGIRREQGR
jgi:spermidine synthase